METIIQEKEKYIKYTLKSFPKLNWEEVDDVFSEAMLRICKRKNPTPITPSYVYVTMKHIIIDEHIRRRSLRIVDEEISVNIYIK